MPIRIAGVQFEPKFMQVEANLAAMAEWTRRAAAGGAKLVIFPEAAVAGYCFATKEEALPYGETLPAAASVKQFTALCRELDVHVIYGALERDGEQLFNVAHLVGPQGLVTTYRKIHLPYLGVDRFTTPGNRPFAVFDVHGMRVGILICYDGAFPEAVRCLALLGADLVALPTNWPPKSECAAQHATATRAWENRIYFAAVNRIGTERGYTFIGGSSVCDPSGNTLAVAAHTEPAMIIADVDPAISRNKQIVRVPGQDRLDRIADRRPEMYGALVAPKPHPPQ